MTRLLASLSDRQFLNDASEGLRGLTLDRLRIELLAGLTVALALVPEAVAFAFVAGVHPLVGLYAAFIVGLVTALIGGRPGMISGATGALAVVMVALVAQHGIEYLFATVVLMGIFAGFALGIKLASLFTFFALMVGIWYVLGGTFSYYTATLLVLGTTFILELDKQLYLRKHCS